MALKNLKKIKQKVLAPPKQGEIVKGEIIATDRSATFLNLGSKGIGIIYGKEFQKAREILKNKELGEEVSAKVMGLENEQGYRELSLAAARKEIAWEEVKEKKKTGEIMERKIEAANKGGLVCTVAGIQGFIPVSHLAPDHYPKLDNPSGAEIARALQKFVGETLTLKVIDLDPGREKLILSEKATLPQQQEQFSEKFSEGDKVEGKITGITSFGAFVDIGKGVEALLPEQKQDLKKGQKVKATIKKIQNNRIWLTGVSQPNND